MTAAKALTRAEQIEKLPRWAQDHIKHLEHEARKLKQRVLEMHGKVGETDVFVHGYHDEDDRPLPARSRIRFNLNNCSHLRGVSDHIDVFIRREGDRNYLEVMSERRLTIHPQVTNVVYIDQDWSDVERAVAKGREEKGKGEIL